MRTKVLGKSRRFTTSITLPNLIQLPCLVRAERHASADHGYRAEDSQRGASACLRGAIFPCASLHIFLRNLSIGHRVQCPNQISHCVGKRCAHGAQQAITNVREVCSPTAQPQCLDEPPTGGPPSTRQFGDHQTDGTCLD